MTATRGAGANLPGESAKLGHDSGPISLMFAMTERESAPFTTSSGPASLGRLQVQKIAGAAQRHEALHLLAGQKAQVWL